MRIAIPCNHPGGLEAKISHHFGECDSFTVVELEKENPTIEGCKVQLIENRDHLLCGTVILRLRKAGIDTIIINKIGEQALKLVEDEGIPIYAGSGTPQQAIQDFIADRLKKVTLENICYGPEQTAT